MQPTLQIIRFGDATQCADRTGDHFSFRAGQGPSGASPVSWHSPHRIKECPTMKKTLVTLALAAVPALLVSACNGGTNGSLGHDAALPNAPAASHHRMHRNDNGPQDLHAGGATFPAIAYNLVNQPVGLLQPSPDRPAQGSLFYALRRLGTIYYCLTAVRIGRKVHQAIPATRVSRRWSVRGARSTATGFRRPARSARLRRERRLRTAPRPNARAIPATPCYYAAPL